MAEVVLRIAGDNVSAIRSVRELVASFNEVRDEEGRVTEAGKVMSTSIQEQARLNVTKAIEQRDALRGIVKEYAEIGKAAGASADVVATAQRLQREGNDRLIASYGEVGLAAKRSANEAAAASAKASEESGIARGFASRTIGLSAFAGGAFIAGAAAGLIIKKATDEATRAQESQAQLENALKQTGISWHDNADEINRYLDSAEKASSFDKIDLRTSLGQLARATGDVGKAQDLLSTATNVARGRHMDLDAAVRLVTRAYQGNVGSLRRVGIDVQAVTTAQDKLREAHVKTTPEMAKQAKAIDTQATATEALRVLNERYSGAAEAHARTLAGREEALGNALTDVSVAIGKAVTPALTRMFEWMTKEIEAAQHSKTVHEVLHDTFHVLGVILRDVVVPMIRFTIDEWRFWIRITGDVVDFVRGELIPAFRTLFHFIESTGRAAWAAVVQTAKGAVYIILQAATAAIRGILEVASHLPFVGDKARAALNSINTYLDHWKPDFSKVDAAFRAGGSSAGQQFAHAAQAAMSQAGAVSHLQPGPGGSRFTTAGGGQGAASVSTGGASGVQARLVSTASTALGNPYQYGGAPSLSSPTDCSGLMVAVFAKNGITLPRTSEAQYAQAPIKNQRPLLPGDLVFSEGIHPGHVGLYIGSGNVLEDPHTGDHVKIVPLSGFGWNGESARWWGGRRSGGHGGGGGGGTTAASGPTIGQIIASGQPVTHAPPAYKGPTGDELVPAALRRATAAVAGRAQRLLAAGAATSGTQAATYYDEAAAAMRQEERDLEREVKRLRDELRGASAGRRKAIEAEIKKIEGTMGSVHGAIRSALQSERGALSSLVSSLQSTVSSAWSSISQAIVQQFEANTQDLVDAVGKRFFQGTLTPEEAQLQAAQAADQVQSLQDALTQAQASGDPAQIKAAQHAIDLYNLEAAAAASRAKADADYADAVKQIQKEREAEEEHLTVALDKFASGLADGTNSVGDLQPMLDKYGVRLGDISDSSFIFKTNLDSLGETVKSLDGALWDLAKLVSEITGKPVKPPGSGGGGGGGGKGGGGKGGGGGSGGGTYSGPPTTIPAFAGGGFISGPMVGPEDTIVARVSTGEGVLSRDEMRLLLTAAVVRPTSPVHSGPIYVLGTTRQEVARALARIVTPAQDRRIGFKGNV